MTRKVTNRLMELVSDGLLNPEDLLMACLNYMSEADVADMASSEGFLDDEEEDEEE